MRLRVYHKTEYYYTAPVTDSVNELRLSPMDTRWQSCEASFLSVVPPTRLTSYRDLHGNSVHVADVAESHQKLSIESRATVRTAAKIDLGALPYGFLHGDLGRCRELEICHPYLQDSIYVQRTPEVWRLAIDIRDRSEDVFETSYAIMEHIFTHFSYRPGQTTVATQAAEVIERQMGVCQDFAHAMVALCRVLDIPARYVSGYFYDGTRNHQLRGSEASHAWVEVYIEGHGWVGLDPTNRKVVDESYIVVAVGRDYRDVAPVVGTYRGAGRSAMSVVVRVSRV
jgi:transglutaminase-like putative cysteine protease